MTIKKGQKYRIKGKSKYFKDKYGTYNPVIEIEDTDENVFGKGGWMWQKGNPACLLYAARSGFEGLPILGKVFYGKICSMGELVHENELELVLQGEKR